MNKGFTLVELLLTVSIVAVIGTGAAVYYGREVLDNANRQIALHEMGQVRDAFQRFWVDNSAQMMDGVVVADTFDPLPSDDFEFSAKGDGQTYSAADVSSPQRFYGVMEFFERYGVWPLLEKSVYIGGARREARFFLDDSRACAFCAYDPAVGAGWRGPYLSASLCTVKTVDGVSLPWIRSKSGAEYRLIFFEHCEDPREGAPIFRRLILVGALKPADIDTWDKLRGLVGNRRYAGAGGEPLDLATGSVRNFDPVRGLCFMELLNFDTTWK